MKLALGLLVSGMLWAQTNPVGQGITFSSPPPDGVNAVNVSAAGNPGAANYYYWVIANYPIGQAAASPYAQIKNAPNTLSGGSYVSVYWSYASPSAVSYDVLRTTGPTIPVPCTCAVATGLTGATINDTGGALGSYTYAPVGQATGSITLDNISNATPLLVYKPNGGGSSGGSGGVISATLTSVGVTNSVPCLLQHNLNLTSPFSQIVQLYDANGPISCGVPTIQLAANSAVINCATTETLSSAMFSGVGTGTPLNGSQSCKTPLIITTTSLPQATVGQTNYNSTIASVGGVPANVWSVISGSLPTGLSLAVGTGVVTSTTVSGGSSSPTFKVTDSIGDISTALLPITVNLAPAISSCGGVSVGGGAVTCPGGYIGNPYTTGVIGVTNGAVPDTCSLTSGSLTGSGLTLNSNCTVTGAVSGSPNTYSFGMMATDSNSVASSTISASLTTATGIAELGTCTATSGCNLKGSGGGTAFVIITSNGSGTPSDGVNTYTNLITGGGQGLAIWYSCNATVTSSMTFTGITGTPVLASFRGVATSSCLDSSGTAATGTSIAPATNSVTPSLGELVYAALAAGNGVTITPVTVVAPFTIAATNMTNTGVSDAYWVASSTSSLAATFGLAASSGFGTEIYTFHHQ